MVSQGASSTTKLCEDRDSAVCARARAKGRRFLSPDGTLTDELKMPVNKLLMRDDLGLEKVSEPEFCFWGPDWLDLTKSSRKEARHATMTTENEGESIS